VGLFQAFFFIIGSSTSLENKIFLFSALSICFPSVFELTLIGITGFPIKKNQFLIFSVDY